MKSTERAEETRAKLTRLRAFMVEADMDLVVLRKTASLSWLTAGAATFVNTAASEGPVTAVVTADRAWLSTSTIEAPRLREQEYLGIDTSPWELVAHAWYEPAAVELIHSLTGINISPSTTGTDHAVPGTRDVNRDLSRLRRVLLPQEQRRMEVLAAACGQVMKEATAAVHPGQTEYEIAAHLWNAAQSRGIQAIVDLVAVDDRIHRFRHPLPTDQKLKRHVLLVLSGRAYGLCASVSRIVHFGSVPDEIRRAQEAVAYVDAVAIDASRPGTTLGEMFNTIVDAYAEAGYPGAWKEHHQGGIAGYLPREALALPASDEVLEDGMVCAWNPSLPGAKSEDTILVGEPPRILTETPDQPTIDPGGGLPHRPGILVR